MKFNQWTLALAAAGVLSLGAIAQAEEAQHQVMTALSSTTLSGYVDTSANWRVGQSDGALPGRTFDGADKQDGFNLNRVQLTLAKPLDEGQWSAGYKVDLVFGPDANYYGNTLNGGGSVSSDVAIKQAYANFRVPVGNGIDVKMGVFDSIIGYEVFETGNNPNSSRSFGYYITPINHTGVLASYQIVDNVSVSGGITDTAVGANNARTARAGSSTAQTEKAYVGSLAITMPDSLGFLAGSTLYGGVVDGLNSAGAGANSLDTTWIYAGYTMNTPVTGLAAGFAFDYRIDGADSRLFPHVTPGSNWARATALYLTYQATEKLKLSARGDWAQGSDGTFYNSGLAGSDRQNDLLGLTLTVDYSLWSNLITRVEGRWDRSLNGDRAFGGDQGVADDRNAFTVALNTIYKF